MKRLLWLITAVLCLLSAACGSSATDDLNPTPADSGGGLNPAPTSETGSGAETDLFPRATLTPPPAGELTQPESATGSDTDGYPPPPSPLPLPEGYELPTAAPTINPYPEATGQLIWILKPVGEQCAETPATPDLQTAVADMIAFGIPVEASEMTEQEVCTACGCPTSAHFRLQIDSGYLGNAQVLGWVAEE